MIPEETQQLQLFILLALNAVGEVGMTSAGLLPRARIESFRDLTEPQLHAELRALADREHVVSYGTALGQKRWRITGRGKAALQEAGLA